MDGIQGMFGQDPALVQQAIQQQKQQKYNENIVNTPFQLGQQIGNQAGGMLGDALGAATGVQDPRMAEAQLGQQVQQKVIEQAKMQGIDPVADPEGFIKLVAQGWMDAGKPDKAYAAVNTLQQMQAQKSKISKEQAEAKKANIIAIGDNAFDISKGAYITPANVGVPQGKSTEERMINGLIQYRQKKDSGEQTTPAEDAWAQAAFSHTANKVSQSGEVADLSSYLDKINPNIQVKQNVSGTQQQGYTPVKQSEKTIREDAIKLGKDVQELALPELDTYSDSITTMIDKYKGKDIPGVGGLNNVPIAGPAYNSFIRSLGPEDKKQYATDAIEMRKSIDGWKAGLIRLSAGLSQTNTEVANQVKKLALSPINTSDDFLKAFKEVGSIVGEQKQNLYGKYGPNVVDYYSAQRQDKRNILAPKAVSTPPKTSTQTKVSPEDIAAMREFLKTNKGYK